MTATQSLKLFEISRRYFQSENETGSSAEAIVTVVDNKFAQEKQSLVTRPELAELKNAVRLLRQDIKIRFAEFESRLKTEFNKQLIWRRYYVYPFGTNFSSY